MEAFKIYLRYNWDVNRQRTCPNFKGGKQMEKCVNKRACPCTYDCPRHGKCCECVAHHRDHDEGVPGCFFSKEAEATYDRSIEALCRDKGLLHLPKLSE